MKKTYLQNLRSAGLATAALLASQTVFADPAPVPPPTPEGGAFTPDKFVQFSATSLSYLYGFNWDTPFSPAKERDILTVEHFNANKLGDFFLFIDVMNLATHGRGNPESDVDIYGEMSPRISLSKILDKPMKFGPIKDIYAYSGTFEFGSAGSLENLEDDLQKNVSSDITIDSTQLRQLHGVAVDFDIPGFNVASLNLYWRDDFDVDSSTWQVTAVWDVPFKLFGADFVFKGFADWAGSEDTLEAQFHTSPQLVMDIGAKLFDTKGTVYFGTEVDIWINEFGVKDQDDFVPQLLLQVYF